MSDILTVSHLSRSFQQGDVRIDVLRDIDLRVGAGEVVALVGPSGSGKSTMLQAIGLLEGGFGGSIVIDGVACARMAADEMTRMRREKLGFVYQFHHLLPDFTALENVVLPQLIAGRDEKAATERAQHLLSDLGLGARLTHRPAQLSGGEQQRVAVARALANQPRLVLADEPTGNLDETTATKVLGEFLRLVRAHGSAAVIATHNHELARAMDRVIVLHEGKLQVA